MAQDRAVAAAAQEVPQGRASALGPQSVPGGHSLDPAERSPLAGSAPAVSLGQHLLAAVARVGTTRALAENLADLPGRTGCPGPTGVVRDLCRRQFRP